MLVATTVDDISPALPIVRNIPIMPHSLESFKGPEAFPRIQARLAPTSTYPDEGDLSSPLVSGFRVFFLGFYVHEWELWFRIWGVGLLGGLWHRHWGMRARLWNLDLGPPSPNPEPNHRDLLFSPVQSRS